MRSLAHWTPRYATARIRQEIYARRHPDSPWLTPEAIGLLDRLLRPTDVAVEFGAGRSTPWIARRVSHLTSVEHDDAWHQNVRARIASAGLANVELLHCPGKEGDPDPEGSAYVRVLDRFPDQGLDFVLVDGVFRSACAVGALAKLRAGGLMVIDNVNWYLPSDTHSPASRSRAQGPADAVWQQLLDMTRDFRRIWTSAGVWDTLILFKS